eukprot:scaffold421345_cov48-Attheya_sp.AAC.3
MRGLEHLHQTVQDDIAKQQGKKREGEKEMSGFDSEASVGKPWTSRIERVRFGTFLSNCPGRNGDEAARKRAVDLGLQLKDQGSNRKDDPHRLRTSGCKFTESTGLKTAASS